MAAQAKRIIEDAVVRKDAGLGDKLLDKAFALAFKGLVYAQIWEDPIADMEARHPAFAHAAEQYQEYNRNMLQYLKDAGIIDQPLDVELGGVATTGFDLLDGNVIEFRDIEVTELHFSPENRALLAKAEKPYRKGEPFDEMRAQIVADPVAAWWWARMAVRDVMSAREVRADGIEQGSAAGQHADNQLEERIREGRGGSAGPVTGAEP
jgi:hypothetical protein